MNSYETEKLAERLQIATLKVDEAIKEARAAFEKTTALLRDAEDEEPQRARMEEELGATLANLRKAKKDLEEKSCWLYYEASKMVRQEDDNEQ